MKTINVDMGRENADWLHNFNKKKNHWKKKVYKDENGKYKLKND